MRVIFLDIDGVLNDHKPVIDGTGWCGIDRDKATLLNDLLYDCGAKIVISSAWRYMIEPETMGIRGFEYMLITHGADAYGRIVGVTPRDEAVGGRSEGGRLAQIFHWLKEHLAEVESYVVLDDMDLGVGARLVKTDALVGLTKELAQKASILLMTAITDMERMTINREQEEKQ